MIPDSTTLPPIYSDEEDDTGGALADDIDKGMVGNEQGNGRTAFVTLTVRNFDLCDSGTLCSLFGHVNPGLLAELANEGIFRIILIMLEHQGQAALGKDTADAHLTEHGLKVFHVIACCFHREAGQINGNGLRLKTSLESVPHVRRQLGGNVAEFVKAAVNDCLNGGIRNHGYINFRSYDGGGWVRIGTNYYF